MSVCKQLGVSTDDETDVEERLKLATEIRDNIEIVHTPEYANFLKYLFPVFYNILRQGQAQVGDGKQLNPLSFMVSIDHPPLYLSLMPIFSSTFAPRPSRVSTMVGPIPCPMIVSDYPYVLHQLSLHV